MNPTSRILVVDDDPAILYLLKILLAAEGYDVVCASSGNEALEYSRAEPFDLYLIDLIMPSMDGIETMLTLSSFRKDAKIIAMSGGWNGGVHNCLTLAEKLGAFSTLAKPFDKNTLINMIQSILEECPRKSKDESAIKTKAVPHLAHDMLANVTNFGIESLEPQANVR